MPEEYKISELSQKAGVTKRTIHYYISKGLIPPPQGAGVGSVYNEEHLLKVLLVKKLQSQFLPLDRIRNIMTGLDMEQIRQMLGQENGEGLIVTADSSSKILADGLDREEEKMDFLELNMPLFSQPALEYVAAKEYIRLDLGKGVELHYPAELMRTNGASLKSIEKYVKKLLDEI